MKKVSAAFNLQVDAVKGDCPAAEVWAEDKIHLAVPVDKSLQNKQHQQMLGDRTASRD